MSVVQIGSKYTCSSEGSCQHLFKTRACVHTCKWPKQIRTKETFTFKGRELNSPAFKLLQLPVVKHAPHVLIHVLQINKEMCFTFRICRSFPEGLVLNERMFVHKKVKQSFMHTEVINWRSMEKNSTSGLLPAWRSRRFHTERTVCSSSFFYAGGSQPITVRGES